MLTIDQVIEKAFTTADLANGGLLNPDQAARLVQGIFENAVIVPESRREPMKANKKVIDKITYTGDILQKPVAVGTEHTTLTEPVTSTVTLDAQEAIVAMDIGFDAIEDSIEQDNLMDSILELSSKRLGFEMDKLILNGDTAGSTGTVLDILDGLFKQATTNTFDVAGATITEVLLGSALKNLPGEHFQDEEKFRFYVSHRVKLDYVDVLASKGVNDAFTLYLVQNKEPAFHGIPVRKVGGIVTETVTGSVDGSKALLVNPANIVWGVHRDITIDMERKPRKRVVEVTMTMRVDVKYERESAVVKLTNIKHA